MGRDPRGAGIQHGVVGGDHPIGGGITDESGTDDESWGDSRAELTKHDHADRDRGEDQHQGHLDEGHAGQSAFEGHDGDSKSDERDHCEQHTISQDRDTSFDQGFRFQKVRWPLPTSSSVPALHRVSTVEMDSDDEGSEWVRTKNRLQRKVPTNTTNGTATARNFAVRMTIRIRFESSVDQWVVEIDWSGSTRPMGTSAGLRSIRSVKDPAGSFPETRRLP